MQPGGTTVDQTVQIPIMDDRINEANEGFLLIVRADEIHSDPLDIANLGYMDEGVTLLRITDDDSKIYTIIIIMNNFSLIIIVFIVIIFQFERPFYTFFETDGVLRDTINVVKMPGNISEQTLTLLVDHTPSSARFGMQILFVFA